MKDNKVNALKSEAFIDIEDLGLSVRAQNVLKNLNITNFIEVAYMTEREFLNLKNCGKKTLVEIKEKLAEFDLYLGTKGNIEMPGVSNKVIPFDFKNSESSSALIFDKIKINTFPKSTRLTNAIKSLNIETIGDFRENIDNLKSMGGLGRKSLNELKAYTEELTGITHFDGFILKNIEILTSPSFLIHLKSIFRDITPDSKSKMGIFLNNELQTLPEYFREYAEEMIEMSFSDLSILKNKIDEKELDYSVLKVPLDVILLITDNKKLSGMDVIINLNKIIVSLDTTPEYLVKVSKEVDLLIECGLDDYKKNKVAEELADTLLENEANIINDLIETICIDETRYDVFMSRIAANENNKLTLEAVGKRNGVTRERIRQIEKKLLEKSKWYLKRKFNKQKELIAKLVDSKTLGFSLNEFKENEYFDDFYTDDKMSVDLYLNIIFKIYSLELKIYDDVVITKKYSESITALKKDIRNFLKRSTETFLPLEDIYHEFFIDENILKYICNNELACESVGDEIVNKYANSQSQRQQVLEAAYNFNDEFTADNIVDVLASRGQSLKASRVVSYISALDEIQVLDFGKYILKSKIDFSDDFESKVLDECIEYMSKKKSIYSLHTLKDMLNERGISHKYLTSFTIGSILSSSSEITKIGKIRYALNEDAENLSDNLIEDNLKAIFYEYKKPLLMKDVKKILIEEYGYADTTAAMFLTKTSDLIKLGDGKVSTVEYSSIDISIINSILSEAEARLNGSNVGLTSFSGLVSDISKMFKLNQVTCESLLKRSTKVYVFPKLDLISKQKNPFESLGDKSSNDIVTILNEQNIFPDTNVLKKYLEELAN